MLKQSLFMRMESLLKCYEENKREVSASPQEEKGKYFSVRSYLNYTRFYSKVNTCALNWALWRVSIKVMHAALDRDKVGRYHHPLPGTKRSFFITQNQSNAVGNERGGAERTNYE